MSKFLDDFTNKVIEHCNETTERYVMIYVDEESHGCYYRLPQIVLSFEKKYSDSFVKFLSESLIDSLTKQVYPVNDIIYEMYVECTENLNIRTTFSDVFRGIFTHPEYPDNIEGSAELRQEIIDVVPEMVSVIEREKGLLNFFDKLNDGCGCVSLIRDDHSLIEKCLELY